MGQTSGHGGKNGSERRRFSRITFHRPALLEAIGRGVEAEVLDLSLKGALVKVPPAYAHGKGVPARLVVRLGGDVEIRMEGEIAHREGDHVGFRCDEVDLESIQHLRRFVELNLGDDDLLHRELAALVAERDW
jgi:hypothetical protein